MKKRNVLIIYQDQTRCDCLPFYGNNEIIAPNLETFAKVMRNAGYRTQYVGKMQASPTYLDIGFDKELFSEQDGDGRFEDGYHEYLRENGLCEMIDVMDQRAEYRKDATEEYFSSFGVKVSDLPEEHHNTTWVTDNAVKLLETWQDEGKLLMVSYIKPHHPFDPFQKFVDMYEGRNLFEEKEFALTEDLKYDQEKKKFYHLYALRNERYTILFERDMDNVLLFDRKTDPYELCDISSSKDHQDMIEKARSFLVSTLLFSRRFVSHEETRSLNVTKDRTTTEQRRSLMIRHYEENRSRNG